MTVCPYKGIGKTFDMLEFKFFKMRFKMGRRDKDKATDDAQSFDEKTKNEKLNEDSENENEESNSTDETQAEEVSPLEELQAKYDELNGKYLRLYSEFDNFRRRTAKEKIELISNASASVLKDLLSVIDDFERAKVHNEGSEDSEAIKEGFDLIYSKLIRTLESKGLKVMESLGTDFDTEHHEAIANVPVDKKQKGKVIDVTVKGYYLNDNVLRHAQVVVGQ